MGRYEQCHNKDKQLHGSARSAIGGAATKVKRSSTITEPRLASIEQHMHFVCFVLAVFVLALPPTRIILNDLDDLICVSQYCSCCMFHLVCVCCLFHVVCFTSLVCFTLSAPCCLFHLLFILVVVPCLVCPVLSCLFHLVGVMVPCLLHLLCHVVCFIVSVLSAASRAVCSKHSANAMELSTTALRPVGREGLSRDGTGCEWDGEQRQSVGMANIDNRLGWRRQSVGMASIDNRLALTIGWRTSAIASCEHMHEAM